MPVSSVGNNKVTVYAVTNFDSKVLNGFKAAKLARATVDIFNEEAAKRDLTDSASLVIEPTLRTQDSWNLVNSLANFCFGSNNTKLDSSNFAVGSVLYPEDVEKAAEVGFKTVVSPMTDRDVLQAAREYKIDAVPAIASLEDGFTLDNAISLSGFEPGRVKVFPFSISRDREGYINTLKGPFSREIESKHLTLNLLPQTDAASTPTEFWSAIKTSGNEASINVGNPDLDSGHGLNTLAELMKRYPRFEDGKSVPVVTGGIRADKEYVTALVANGIRHFGLSALLTDDVQKTASQAGANFGELKTNIGIILDGIKSGLEVGS